MNTQTKEKPWTPEEGTKKSIWFAIFIAAIMLGVASESAKLNAFLVVPPLIVVLSLCVRFFKSRAAAIAILCIGLLLLVLSLAGDKIGIHPVYNWHLSIFVAVLGSAVTYTTFAISRKNADTTKKENRPMRIIAIVINLLLFVMAALYLIEARDSGQQIFGGVVLFVAIFSAITLYLTKSESWIGLYLKRRTMEEKQKIEGLKKG